MSVLDTNLQENNILFNCTICLEYSNLQLFKICSCSSSYFCQECLNAMRNRSIIKCPICRQDLDINKNIDIYRNLVKFKKPLIYISLYILYVVLPIYIINKKYFEEYNSVLNNEYCRKNCINNQLNTDTSIVNQYFNFMNRKFMFMMTYFIQKLIILPSIILLWNFITYYSKVGELMVNISYFIELIFIMIIKISKVNIKNLIVYNFYLNTFISLQLFLLMNTVIIKALYLYVKYAKKDIIYKFTYRIFDIWKYHPLINNYVIVENSSSVSNENLLENENPININRNNTDSNIDNELPKINSIENSMV